MAVIAAMVLEGGGLDEAPSSPPETPSAPRAAASQPASLQSSRRPQRTPPYATSSAAPESERDSVAVADPTSSLGLPVRLGLVMAGSAESAVAPSVGWGIAAGVELSGEGPFRSTASLRVLGRTVRTRKVSQPGYGDADFSLDAATLMGCPLRWPARSFAGLRPCAVVDIGDLRGKGSNTVLPKERHMLWLGFGAAVRAEFQLVRWVSLELEGRGLVLARQDEFLFEPDAPVHDVPLAALSASAGFLLWVPP